MVEESAGVYGAPRTSVWRKAIPEERDRQQSEWLVIVVGMALAMILGLRIFNVVGMEGPPHWFSWSVAGCAVFAVLVWRMKAATTGAAALGGLFCLCTLISQRNAIPWWRTAFPDLVTLFLLTFLATRFGRRHKEAMGTAEERHGRRASQIAANLAIAALAAAWIDHDFLVGALAALAEATADTVSSELGQVLGGRTIMVTTGRTVAPGTDGGISVAGTAFGAASAASVAVVAVITQAVDPWTGVLVCAAGCAGLVFDSVLGATVERKGWLGNDLVNFSSTLFAGFLAKEVWKYLGAPVPTW